MRYAVIDQNGLVTNVIVLDDVHAWEPPSGCVLVQSDTADPGGSYAGGVFSPASRADTQSTQASVPEAISDRQFFQQLALQRVITQDEALSAVKTGTLPTALQSYVNTLDPSTQFAAAMLLSGATVFLRHHPITGALGAGMGWTSAQLDALWAAAAAL